MAQALGIDVDAAEVRATSATSAKLAAQAGEQARVKKKKLTKRGKGKSHDARRAAAKKEQNEGAPQ